MSKRPTDPTADRERPAVSVLDLSPVFAGGSAAESLRRSVALATSAEALGFARYWVGEHHNNPGLTSSSPEILISAIAMSTSRIRVGSGGVTLANRSALAVAEAFRALEALNPGRVDLGLVRAPGTDMLTALALRRSKEALTVGFDSQVEQLLAFADGAPDGSLFDTVTAMPCDAALPPLWICGAGTRSARLAAGLGAGFAFAGHLSYASAAAAVNEYRSRFRGASGAAGPRVILCVPVICATTEGRAAALARVPLLAAARRDTGHVEPLPTPEQAAAHAWTGSEREVADRHSRLLVAGTPETVRQDLLRRAADAGADELMIVTEIGDLAERTLSLALTARSVGLRSRSLPTAPQTLQHLPPERLQSGTTTGEGECAWTPFAGGRTRSSVPR